MRITEFSRFATSRLSAARCIPSVYVSNPRDIFPAGSDTRFGLICDTVTMWCVVVPAGLIAAFVLKLPVLGVYLVLNTDEIIKLPVVYWYYKKYRWLKNITREII